MFPPSLSLLFPQHPGGEEVLRENAGELVYKIVGGMGTFVCKFLSLVVSFFEEGSLGMRQVVLYSSGYIYIHLHVQWFIQNFVQYLS